MKFLDVFQSILEEIGRVVDKTVFRMCFIVSFLTKFSVLPLLFFLDSGV